VDAHDRRLLDALQAGLPLVRRPHAPAAAAPGLAEAEALARLRALTEAGVLRQVVAIFDTAQLGYRSSLVAARVAPGRIEAAARAINAHPGVSHNYERDHAWNLWFTLAVPPDSRLGLEATAERLARDAGAERHWLLPALRIFKIGVRLDMDAAASVRQEAPPSAGRGVVPAAPLTAAEREAVRILQEPLPLDAEPFDALAERADIGFGNLLARARALAETGVLRRLAGLLHHRRAGFTANVMGVWVVPEARIEAAGAAAASFRAVSHCYQRPTHADWPYSLFTMVHGRTHEECLGVLDAIARAASLGERAALWTRREWKKVRLRYFTPEYAAWERAA
jgi:siroheme decarboxylase